MVYVKPFQGIRPQSGLAKEVSALPYDVMNRQEAAEMAAGKENSILHITRAEIDFPAEVGDYDDRVYAKARENLDRFLAAGVLNREEKPVYYIYRETMNGISQTGIVAVVAVSDYKNDIIMKHELTRKEKEQDRIRHFAACDCQTEPIFLTYRHQKSIEEIMEQWSKTHNTVYDFISEDDIRHQLWVIDDDAAINALEKNFAALPKMYIADGHHRTASAAAICELKAKAGVLKPEDPANYIMAVIFPDTDLNIMAYHRIVKAPENFDFSDFETYLKSYFTISEITENFPDMPNRQFGLYWEHKWYHLIAEDRLYKSERTADNLDAAVLQKYVLAPYFSIDDPRTDPRIDFIGGIRGRKEIQRRCDEENCIGIYMSPVSIHDLMAVADQGQIMPPKSTWFEPKLRSGLFLHSFSANEGETK